MTSVRDPLTGLFNGQHLEQKLKSLVYQAGQAGQPLSFIIGDLGGLKNINNQFGRVVGDLLLQTVARVMVESMEGFVCWRVGGDAFAVGLLGVDREQAEAYAQRLRDQVTGIRMETPAGPISPTFAVGISTFPDDAQSSHGLMRVADRRMHHARATEQAASSP